MNSHKMCKCWTTSRTRLTIEACHVFRSGRMPLYNTTCHYFIQR